MKYYIFFFFYYETTFKFLYSIYYFQNCGLLKSGIINLLFNTQYFIFASFTIVFSIYRIFIPFIDHYLSSSFDHFNLLSWQHFYYFPLSTFSYARCFIFYHFLTIFYYLLCTIFLTSFFTTFFFIIFLQLFSTIHPRLFFRIFLSPFFTICTCSKRSLATFLNIVHHRRWRYECSSTECFFADRTQTTI